MGMLAPPRALATALSLSVALGVLLQPSSADACSYSPSFTMTVPANGEVVGPDTKVGFRFVSGRADFPADSDLRLTDSSGQEVALTAITTQTDGSIATFVTATPTEPLLPGTYTLESKSPTHDFAPTADLSSSFTVSAASDAGPPSDLAPDARWEQVGFAQEGFTNNSCGSNSGLFHSWITITSAPELEGRAQWYEVTTFLPGNETLSEVVYFEDPSATSRQLAVWTEVAPTCVEVKGFTALGTLASKFNSCTPDAVGTHPGGDVGLSLSPTSEDIQWGSGGQDSLSEGCATGGSSSPYGLLWLLVALVVIRKR